MIHLVNMCHLEIFFSQVSLTFCEYIIVFGKTHKLTYDKDVTRVHFSPYFCPHPHHLPWCCCCCEGSSDFVLISLPPAPDGMGLLLSLPPLRPTFHWTTCKAVHHFTATPFFFSSTFRIILHKLLSLYTHIFHHHLSWGGCSLSRCGAISEPVSAGVGPLSRFSCILAHG